MLYSEMRRNIKTGDLLIWKVTKISSFIDFVLYLYQKIFKTEYSHVGIAIVFGDRVFCLDAAPPLVRLMPLSMMKDFSVLHTNIPWRNNFHRGAFHRSALQHIGKKYDLTDLVRALFKLSKSDNELYCSEMIAVIFKDIGFIKDEGIGIDPKTLVEYLKNKTGNEPIFVSIDRDNTNGV